MGYQGRKKRKTTNALYLTDRQGLPLAMFLPVSGHHHDLIEIETHFEQLISPLKQAGIALNGLFLNLDSGFDAENLRTKSASMDIIVNIAHNKRNSGVYNNHYFDEVLYKERYAIERTNA